jgi:hypothetical protein
MSPPTSSLGLFDHFTPPEQSGASVISVFSTREMWWWCIPSTATIIITTGITWLLYSTNKLRRRFPEWRPIGSPFDGDRPGDLIPRSFPGVARTSCAPIRMRSKVVIDSVAISATFPFVAVVPERSSSVVLNTNWSRHHLGQFGRTPR